MKEIATTILRNLDRVFASLALFAFATVGTAFAENISKTFEFGAGTPQPRSHVRTFNIPCGTPGGVAAVVKFQRLGPDGPSNDIPIIIELREPDTAANQEGPIVETKTAIAKKTEQTVILRSQASNRGCSLPWRIRVRYANEGTAPVQTFSSIRLDFDGRLRNIDAEFGGCLKKAESVTKNLGGRDGFQQGRMEITADWDHGVGPSCLLGPNPVKLKIQLIDPSGTIVRTVEAYSSAEARSELPRFKLVYQVTSCVSGQWKLKFTNLDSNDDALIKYPRVKFTPACP